MSVFHTNILAGASGAGGGAAAAAFQIDRSIRLNSADSAHLNRTPSSAGNRRTWTWSGWVKRSSMATSVFALFGAYDSSNTRDVLRFESNKLNLQIGTSGTYRTETTVALFRDPSAWYHIVAAFDSTQATAADRLKLYVNGVEQSVTGDPVVQNTQSTINNTDIHYVGARSSSGSAELFFDGYMTEVNFVDGTQLAASDFGEYDSNNVWQPKDTSGLTFGTNGFRLKFDDNSSSSALGNDSSGNDNDWTAVNLSAAQVDNNWADYVYASDSTYSSTATGTNFFTGAGSQENLFDGSTSTQVGSVNANMAWVYFRPATAITGVTSLRIWGSYNSTTRINGTDYQESPAWSSTPQWVSVPSPPSSITEIAIQGSAARISAIEVNGTVLVDPIPAAGVDSLIDSPMNYTATSGNNGGNYCVLNPLDISGSSTVSNGNLECSVAAGATNVVSGNFHLTSGKWYWEVSITSSTTKVMVGVADGSQEPSSREWQFEGWYYYGNNGRKYHSSSAATYGSSFGQDDIIGVALDMDNGTLTFYKNGTSQGVAYNTGLSGLSIVPSVNNGGGTESHTVTFNFGQRPFVHTPPSNHLSICTQNLSNPTIADGSTAMDAITYTGNGSSKTISGVGFSSDLIWTKTRNEARSNYLMNTIRGITKYLVSEQSSVEGTNTTNRILSLTSDGWTLGSNNGFNGSSDTYVAWAWDAGSNSSKTFNVKVVSDSGNKYRFDDFGTSAVTLDLEEGSTYVFDQSDSSNSGHPLRFSTTSNGTHGGGSEYTTGVTTTGTPGSAGAKTTIVVAASAPTLYYYCSAHSGMGGQANTNSTAGASNFDGTHQSTVQANSSTGFSISIHSRTTAASISTWGHGLNAAPEFAILKPYNGSYPWIAWHKSMGNKKRIYLNSTGSGNSYSFDVWSSSSTTLGVYGTIIAGGGTALDCATFAWAPIEGYSRFGSYEGTGSSSTGAFVYTGFRPKVVMTKDIDSASNWNVWDTSRSPQNLADERLRWSGNAAEDSNGDIDILSNGFKIRDSSSDLNENGRTFIWAAWAEHPFKTARAR